MRHMRRNIWLIAISIVAVLILVNNTVYYFLTKSTLENGLRDELLGLAGQIELSVEQSRQGAELYEEGIGRELRAAAIAAQYALDPDIEKVTDEQLVELGAKLDLAHITLLKKTADDIVLYRSSDTTQIGKSTKQWVPWHSYFQQLFAMEEVKKEWLGQSMTHFWSGPFEASSTEVEKVYKWGYYYDGTSNYIVDPYVNFQRQDEYNRVTGVERFISGLVEHKESLLQISVVNPRTFPEGVFSENESGNIKAHFVQRAIIYGDYTIKSEKDLGAVQEAYRTKEMVQFQDRVEGKLISKMFVPVYIDDKGISITDETGKKMDAYIISITSDYGIIKDRLGDQFFDLGLIIALFTLASLTIAAVAMRYYKQSRDKAVRVTQQTYTDEINSLFHSIRAQRHDFLNHVQTLHSLAELGKAKELAAYTKELTGEIRLMNDIINIGNPAIAALIRSKVSQAESYKICFSCSFNGLSIQGMGARTLDMNRVLGNLIDNSFDEVMKYEENLRKVELTINQSDNEIVISIANVCQDARELADKPLFNSGFTTKLNEHQGLGLYIVKSIADRYKGQATVTAIAPDRIQFDVMLPL